MLTESVYAIHTDGFRVKMHTLKYNEPAGNQTKECIMSIGKWIASVGLKVVIFMKLQRVT
jgi:hypothetical protein